MVLYRVSPGSGTRTKVTESEIVTIPAGTPPGWMRIPVRAAHTGGGLFWIMIHTGDTGGVIRNFGGGAPNWYGTADTFADGSEEELDFNGVSGLGTITATVEVSTRIE